MEFTINFNRKKNSVIIILLTFRMTISINVYLWCYTTEKSHIWPYDPFNLLSGQKAHMNCRPVGMSVVACHMSIRAHCSPFVS